MFDFLKKFMNSKEFDSNNYLNSAHRILKTDIKKDPNIQEDEIIFGCGCFWS